ncbi:UNVERIFIED_CONTAM: hypothetical protein K2H54_071469 [Gekko kuhli]
MMLYRTPLPRPFTPSGNLEIKPASFPYSLLVPEIPFSLVAERQGDLDTDNTIGSLRYKWEEDDALAGLGCWVAGERPSYLSRLHTGLEAIVLPLQGVLCSQGGTGKFMVVLLRIQKPRVAQTAPTLLASFPKSLPRLHILVSPTCTTSSPNLKLP